MISTLIHDKVLQLKNFHYNVPLVRNGTSTTYTMLPENVVGMISFDLAKVASSSKAVKVVKGNSLHAGGLDVQVSESHQ